MGQVHPVVSSGSGQAKPQSVIAVVCAYACVPDGDGEAGSTWRQTLELARAGFDVWLVTHSDHRPAIERAVEAAEMEGLHALFWDAPGALEPLKRGPLARLHCSLWYWIVGRAIADWQNAVGMYVLRRIVRPSRASITYLVLPSVQREQRPGLVWRALSQ